MADTITLWRPVGQRELELVAESGWKRLPPRLTGQPIFYPVLNEASLPDAVPMSTWSEVVRDAEITPGVSILDADEAAAVARRFIEVFVDDGERRWWWEALRREVATEAFGLGETMRTGRSCAPSGR